MGERALTRRSFLLVALLSSSVVGCGSDEGGGRAARPSSVERQLPEPPVRRRRSELYDVDGRLKASETVVAGLRLPVGFEHFRDDDRTHVYRSELPVDDVLQYFAPLLLTPNIERVGAGAIYADVVPAGVSGEAVHLDVSVLPRSGGGSRIDIFERYPEGAEPAPLPPERTEEE